MPRPLSRVPLPVRRLLLMLGVIAAVAGLPGTAQAAVGIPPPAGAATSATLTARVLVASPAHPASPAVPLVSARCLGWATSEACSGFCTAGSSGLIGDLNNICQQSAPAPEPATGGLDALIRPPASAIRQSATLYDSYGMAGQSWSAYGLQCSDFASIIGNQVAGVVFTGAKALDRVTITVYQSAAGEGILAWLSGVVDRLITSLGNAIYFPFLAPVVIIGAIWLAWQGLIRKRASRTIEGTIWMVLACATAIWLIGPPADFTGVGKTVSDGITQTLNIAFAKLPHPPAEQLRAAAEGRPAAAGRDQFRLHRGQRGR